MALKIESPTYPLSVADRRNAGKLADALMDDSLAHYVEPAGDDVWFFEVHRTEGHRLRQLAEEHLPADSWMEA